MNAVDSPVLAARTRLFSVRCRNSDAIARGLLISERIVDFILPTHSLKVVSRCTMREMTLAAHHEMERFFGTTRGASGNTTFGRRSGGESGSRNGSFCADFDQYRSSGGLNYITHYGFSPLRGGTTRTRRPNNLESSEYAPGPRSASAAASRIGNMNAGLLR